MILRILAPYLTPILASALAVSLLVVGVQAWRLDRAQSALSDCQHSITNAVAESQVRAAITGSEALNIYVESVQQDAPAIERVVTRTRNVCVREPARDLPVPAVPDGNRQAAAAAQVAADDAVWLGVIADDIETCASALNVCRAQYQFHNANVGGAR